MSAKAAAQAKAPPPPQLKCSQALVLVENFGPGGTNFCLEPCPLETPLKRVLQLLERHDLPEVFVFTARRDSLARELQLGARRWRCAIKFIFSENCCSLGDVLREVHRMAIINSDFLLIWGNVVSDLNLRHYIRLFEERAERSRVIAMKFFVREEPDTPAELRERNFVMLERNSRALRHFERMPAGDEYLLREHGQFAFRQAAEDRGGEQLELHFNLEDAGLTLCSLDVFSVYSEHFEFASEQDDFIRDVITSEIPEEQVLAAIVPDSVFHFKVNSSFKLLRAALLQLKHCGGALAFDRAQFQVRLRDNHTLSRSAAVADRGGLGLNVFVGAGSRVEPGARLRNVFVGSGCVVGPNCTLLNCFLGDGAEVLEGTALEGVCWLRGEDAEQREASPRGWAEQPRSRKNSLFYPDEPVEERRAQRQETAASLEERFLYGPASPEQPGQRLTDCAVKDGLVARWTRPAAGELDETDDYELCSDDEEATDALQSDARIRETLARLTSDLSNIDAMQVNLVNLRLAENRTFAEMIQVIAQEILLKAAAETGQNAQIALLTRLRPLLAPFVTDAEDRAALLGFCERFCRGGPAVKFHQLMQMLFKLRLVGVATMLAWRAENAAAPDEFAAQELARLQGFFDWLGEEEDEESSESSEEGER